ncbi:DUF1223 domain-containing protein [Maribacter sp. 2304DJ31-5]|uniref:DUF1223 domain-containing protein n=1 Tax=Maribacter sp. 2304DJ31-5 TaxID=3386273 RepID=UPI0039BD8C69
MKKIIIPALLGLVLCLMAFKEFQNGKETVPAVDVLGETKNGTIVLELFTSQGCSSCPPADVLLEELKKKNPENVLALSYHVDYWNYIGWKDPFSNPAYTVKQRNYNLKFRNRSNYTPQLVINGKEHLVGSHRAKVLSKLKQYNLLDNKNRITLTGDKIRGKVNFNYEISGDIADKELRAVLVLNERTTSVKRGENRNRILRNSNIVVAEKYLKTVTNNGRGSIEIPPIVSDNEKISLMLISQSTDLEVTGAAKVDL